MSGLVVQRISTHGLLYGPLGEAGILQARGRARSKRGHYVSNFYEDFFATFFIVFARHKH
jgi:hypothetical protein